MASDPGQAFEAVEGAADGMASAERFGARRSINECRETGCAVRAGPRPGQQGSIAPSRLRIQRNRSTGTDQQVELVRTQDSVMGQPPSHRSTQFAEPRPARIQRGSSMDELGLWR